VGLPWYPGATRIEAEWDGDVCLTYRHTCLAQWGAADVRLRGTAEPLGRLDGFTDPDDGALVLTHPLDGYFRKPNGRLGRYAVWHERLHPTIGHAVRARYAVFDEIGLVDPNTTPHSVLLQRSVDFVVILPPTQG
jgi:hypothetical protein